MIPSSNEFADATPPRAERSITPLVLATVVGTCLLLSGLAQVGPLHEWMRQVCWEDNKRRKEIPFYCYTGHFVDYEERFLHDEMPSVDYSRGGVYFLGASSLKWALKPWDLPPDTRPFIHDFAFGGTKHSDQGDFVRFLVREKGLTQAGGEKTLVVFGVNYRLVHHGRLPGDSPSTYIQSIWNRHGFYAVDPDGTIRSVPGNALFRQLLLERSKITGLLREAVNLVYSRFVAPRVHNFAQYNEEWVSALGSNWKELITAELGALERAIQFMQERKIKVAVVLFPMGSWDDPLPYQPFYVKKLREICDSAGVKVYDFTKLLTDDEFANSDHLNAEGIEKFQQAVMGICLDHLRSAGLLAAANSANQP